MRGVAVGWISLLALVARTLGVGHCRFCLLLHFAIAVLALDRSRGFQVTEGEGGGSQWRCLVGARHHLRLRAVSGYAGIRSAALNVSQLSAFLAPNGTRLARRL